MINTQKNSIFQTEISKVFLYEDIFFLQSLMDVQDKKLLPYKPLKYIVCISKKQHYLMGYA